MRLRIAAAVTMLALPCAALESAQWPPPQATAQRMQELREVIMSRDSTAAQREGARDELSGLLKSPAGQSRGRSRDERPARPARAAIVPYPSVVEPVNIAPAHALPGAEAARLEVVIPPRPVVNPQTGSVLAPSGRIAIDPRTGAVLHDTGNGWVDPQTGRFTPR